MQSWTTVSGFGTAWECTNAFASFSCKFRRLVPIACAGLSSLYCTGKPPHRWCLRINFLEINRSSSLFEMSKPGGQNITILRFQIGKYSLIECRRNMKNDNIYDNIFFLLITNFKPNLIRLWYETHDSSFVDTSFIGSYGGNKNGEW